MASCVLPRQLVPWKNSPRRGTFTINVMAGLVNNGGPFTAGPRRKRLLLHSVGPSRPARQQTPTDGQWTGSGCISPPAAHCCLRPHARLAL